MIKKNKIFLTIIVLICFIIGTLFWLVDFKKEKIPQSSKTEEVNKVPNTKTEIVEYKQTDIPKNSKKGSCWTVSIASSGSRAWRCSTDHTIYDPCFETDSGQVVCGVDSENEKDAFELKLTEPLPKQRNANTRESSYWKIELENGLNCYIFTGTAGNLNNEYVYHYCPPYGYLLSGMKIGENNSEDITLNKNGEYWKVRMVSDPDDKGYSQVLPVEEVNVIRVWK